MDLHRPSGEISGYCFTVASVCEAHRKEAITTDRGKPTPCVTQHTAYCFKSSFKTSMSSQIQCARTMENCKIRRKFLMDNPRAPDEEFSECGPTLNTERYTSKEPDSEP